MFQLFLWFPPWQYPKASFSLVAGKDGPRRRVPEKHKHKNKNKNKNKQKALGTAGMGLHDGGWDAS
jgi:hypothetical protein